MYYRYRVKKKDRHIFRNLFVLVLLAALGYAIYTYHDYLFFWEYNDNKLQTSIRQAESIQDREQRRKALEAFSPVIEDYRNSNPLKAEAFFLSARLSYDLGCSHLPGTFSELVVNDSLSSIPEAARNEFFRTIRFVKKGVALKDGEDVDPSMIFILAYSCYYNSFLGIDELNAVLSSINPESLGSDVDNIRFYALMNILNENEEAGFTLLNEKGRISESRDGLLFLATVERTAGRYTNAIMNYRKVLDSAADDRLKRLVHLNLGKIYYNQSLFAESLTHFNEALRLDDKDIAVRIWIGKSYAALGFRDKARALWSEVLNADRTNEEARKLLGVL